MKLIVFIAATIQSFLPAVHYTTSPSEMIGAWTAKEGNTSFTLVFEDGYFSFACFDIPGKKFIRTYGGTFTASGGALGFKLEFDSAEKETVGTTKKMTARMDGSVLLLDTGNGIRKWTKIDDGKNALPGNWRITGRMRDGQMELIPLRARKTVKLLSGTRFQWVAINTETKEFFGTGGGTYTFLNGKYTEHIEFFSRDSSRVGASLSFDGSINDKVWTHKGASSKGDPIHEEWTREN